jgi:hypothetical protein
MRAIVLGLALVIIASGSVSAAEWDGVRPGLSTQDTVRAHFGSPTKQLSQKVDGYDSVVWVYEGDQAPRGMVRVTLGFGLLTPAGYRADIARVMRLEPRPGVFTRNNVVTGWGPPQQTGNEKGADVFFYEAGLMVFFDKDAGSAKTMIFTPPQQPAVRPPR